MKTELIIELQNLISKLNYKQQIIANNIILDNKKEIFMEKSIIFIIDKNKKYQFINYIKLKCNC